MNERTRRLIWFGDAGCPSGFARCTHAMLEELQKTWDVVVCGLNYRGEPHTYPYPIFPAFLYPEGDAFGITRIGELLRRFNPDLVIVQNDPWNVPRYLERLTTVPVIASVAVDGLNCRGRGLNGLLSAIFWTEFGRAQARAGGYAGRSAVVPLGVDTDVYRPMDRLEARRLIGLPEKLHDKFIVGNINRNQPRKRLDLTIAYFAEWVRKHDIGDAYLFLHVAPTGDTGFDLEQLGAYYGVANRLILATPEIWHGVEESALAQTYNCFDVQISTTQGEGWGLCTMEGMACGVPQIVPDWAALGEWCGAAVWKIACTAVAVTPNLINVVGGVPDRDDFVQALDAMYRHPEFRQVSSRQGIELVSQSCYRWPAIAKSFSDEVDMAFAGLPATTVPTSTPVEEVLA